MEKYSLKKINNISTLRSLFGVSSFIEPAGIIAKTLSWAKQLRIIVSYSGTLKSILKSVTKTARCGVAIEAPQTATCRNHYSFLGVKVRSCDATANYFFYCNNFTTLRCCGYPSPTGRHFVRNSCLIPGGFTTLGEPLSLLALSRYELRKGLNNGLRAMLKLRQVGFKVGAVSAVLLPVLPQLRCFRKGGAES